MISHGNGILIPYPFIEVVAAVKSNDLGRKAGHPVSVAIHELTLEDCVRAWEIKAGVSQSA